MPGFLLHFGATVLCAHGGQAQPASLNARVLVNGQPVAVQPSPHLITACPFFTGGNPMPCITAQWTTAATRILCSGMPVLLMDSQAICTPNGTPVTIISTQTKVSGV